MAVTQSDIEFRLSGGSSNSDPNASIGGIMSSTEIVDDTVANLFDNVTGGEAASGSVEYRCFYIVNTHGTDSLSGVKLWIESNTPSADTVIDIALDPAGIGDGASTGVAVTPSPLDELTAPGGVSFELSPLPVDESTAIEIGDLDAGEAQAVWVRRTVSASASPVSNDAVVLRFSGVPA
jgi:hypothetical protein